MSAPWYDLTSKVEHAAQAVVNTLSLTGTPVVRTGQDDDTLTLPCIICGCENTGEEIPRESGNFIVTLRVSVKSEANDTSLATHRANVATVFDKFREDTINTTLGTSLDDFYAYPVRDARIGKSRDTRDDGGAVMTDWIELDFLACPSDIT